jgi:hypothetical protein
MKIKQLLNLEWDAIAGLTAAVLAIILHLLHVVDEHIILPIVLGLLGLLFINFMRHTRNNEITAEQVQRTADSVSKIQAALKGPEVTLIGPRHLRAQNEQFVRHMSGETIWYNVCLSMYKPQPLFDAMLRPAIDSSLISSIQFILDQNQKELWQQFIQPQIATCSGHAKVREPLWCDLPKTLSFILADNQLSGGAEALLSFWGEPFMAQSTARDVPRFIFHVEKNAELLPHLMELARASGQQANRV